MCVKNLITVLFFVLAASFCTVSSQVCGDDLFSSSNTTYFIKRNLALLSLASNVISPNGPHNISVGNDLENIYVLGMCIPGTESQVCSNCIENASVDLLENCPNQTDSFNWRAGKTLCFVRYSNRSFFNSIGFEPHQEKYTTKDITGNVTEFNRIWEEFMDRMIIAASSSIYGNYAADITTWTRSLNIYALMQCIPGISSRECDACLRENVQTYQNCCSGKQGGSIRRPVCYSRWDLYPFFGAFDNITSKPMPPPGDPPNATKKDERMISTTTIIVVVLLAALILVLLALGFAFCKWRKSYKPMKLEIDVDITSSQPLQYDLKTIKAATDNFSDMNKLGQGGFGAVYKGTFPNGTEGAVKRLSRTSEQGLQEFKNEVLVVAKLQHNNLVKLLGFCSEGEEKILVYEFLSNKSLDYFLFDTMNQQRLDWTRRYSIIEGVARGILYLHRDSRLKVIHRDLKASNILLDADMNPKIADFGMAKIFAMEQTRAETSRIAGTYGYMAPEYLMHGQFSIESDVYSFGVLVLEIISGTASSSFYQINGTSCNLVTYAWKLWRKGSALELVDPIFGGDYQSEIVVRCIQIALLCVQENPADRPNLSTIISMLTTSKITLSVPHEPGHFLQGRN